MSQRELEKSIKEFADAHWPDRTPASRLRKLGEEFGELAEAYAEYQANPRSGSIANVKSEAADMAIVLIDLMALMGGSLDYEIHKKMAENTVRFGAQEGVASPTFTKEDYDKAMGDPEVSTQDVADCMERAMAKRTDSNKP